MILTFIRYIPILLCVAIMLGCNDAVVDDANGGPGRAPRVGEIAPDFTQNDTSNMPVKLSDFRGKVVLVDFWASWCSPCRAAIPQFREIRERYRNREFVILSVSLDQGLDAWKKYIRENDLDWVHVADGQYWNNAVARAYYVDAIPRAYLIDKAGIIVGVNSFTYAKIDSALAD